MEVLHRIDQRVRTTRYVHVTRVDERAGRYDFDCSGMAAWVLSRAAPAAHAAVMRRNGRGRPVARDYHDVIAAAPKDHPRGPWLRVARMADVRPGDIIAWRKPATVVSQNTGHVAFVVAPPQRLDRAGHRYLVRIADATSIPHGDDTRAEHKRSGFGYGTILLYLDEPHGEPTGFGWFGSPKRVDFRTHVAIGRAVL
ncbi:hypothetical protein [Polyangium sp. y55x31]|uniref:hypothetical protein n=1 Tax=Polyangium sp. y55x31 TaxID=3042688 RepID=UPI0024823AAE|nr:hypothetical protein [Polyangium sp. y55x31]